MIWCVLEDTLQDIRKYQLRKQCSGNQKPWRFVDLESSNGHDHSLLSNELEYSISVPWLFLLRFYYLLVYHVWSRAPFSLHLHAPSTIPSRRRGKF